MKVVVESRELNELIALGLGYKLNLQGLYNYTVTLKSTEDKIFAEIEFEPSPPKLEK